MKPAEFRRYLPGGDLGIYGLPYNYKDVEYNRNRYIDYMLSRTNSMFEYSGLPRTMPPSVLELFLQSYGAVAVTKMKPSAVLANNDSQVPMEDELPENENEVSTGTYDEDAPDLYCFRANFGGVPDVYYRPTIAVIANPALRDSLELRIGKECVMFKNDLLCTGLLPLYSRFAFEMAEVDISLIMALVNSRIQNIITANTGSDYQSALDYINSVMRGDLAAIATKPFLDGVSVTNNTNDSYRSVQAALEAVQSLKVSWYNELGIDPSFSLKREYVSAQEIRTNNDVLMPLVDNMLECRLLACEQINELYGTNITVKKASSWERKEEEAIQTPEDLDGEAGSEVTDNASDDSST